MLSRTILRAPRTIALSRPLSTTPALLKDTRVDEPSGAGVKSNTSQHINPTSEHGSSGEKNEYLDQARFGKEAKEKGTADTRADPGGMTKQAEKDIPEAPRPIIGMKEERGKVSVHDVGLKTEMLTMTVEPSLEEEDMTTIET